MSEREVGAKLIVKKWSLWSAGVGIVPIPLVDLIGTVGIQVKMLKDLADHYELPFKEDLGKTAVASLVGGVGATGLGWSSVRSLIKAIPLVGTVAAFTVMPAFAGASTMAAGKVFIQHFESGGTFLTFDPNKVRGFYEEELAKAKGASKKT